MKCKHVQQRLLATSGRRKLSAEAAAHLDGCVRCRRWETQLGLLDRSVRLLPAPDSAEAKAALIASLLEPVRTSPSWSVRVSPTVWRRALVGLAAGIVVLLAARALIHTNSSHAPQAPGADPLLARVLDRNMQLAGDSSVPKRVETLAGLADDLDGETRNLARVARADDLTALAAMYDDVLRRGLVLQAGNMTADDKARLLPPIADRLFAASQSATQLAQEVPPSAAAPLKKMAAAAQFANDSLRSLVAAAAAQREDKLAHDTPMPAPGGRS